jgi:hypothetical protein
VRHPELTQGVVALVPPLVWAAANNSTQSVLMLLGHGARAEGPAARTAFCLAQELGRREIADTLAQYGAANTADACPASSATLSSAAAADSLSDSK